ncbi:MAG: hypothetical protein AAGA81_19535 [Acidobacteriota bacterium]
MKSRSFRAVALTIATVTALVGSAPMVMSAADEAVEIASRTSVTANDVQVANKVSITGRNAVSITGRNAVSITGRNAVSITGRNAVSITGRS